MMFTGRKLCFMHNICKIATLESKFVRKCLQYLIVLKNINQCLSQAIQAKHKTILTAHALSTHNFRECVGIIVEINELCKWRAEGCLCLSLNVLYFQSLHVLSITIPLSIITCTFNYYILVGGSDSDHCFTGYCRKNQKLQNISKCSELDQQDDLRRLGLEWLNARSRAKEASWDKQVQRGMEECRKGS